MENRERRYQAPGHPLQDTSLKEVPRVKQEKQSDNNISRLVENKISNIWKTNPEFIATGNIGCITQIANGTKIPILHTVEIIDWYTGGPKPEVLKKL